MASEDLFEKAAELLAQSRRPVAFTGAGVSAESGIPTYRDSGGLWAQYRVEDVATPEGFARDPRLVWEFYNLRRNELWKIEPNPAHYALADLEQLFPEFVVVTQNVDRLHQKAGSSRVIELHGNICEVRCVDCGATFDRTGQELEPLPRCERCSGLLRPAVVWFGEPLPPEAWRAAEEAVNQCDCLLVVGTSARVYPAAGLVDYARRAGARVLEFNLQPSAASDLADVLLLGKAGETLPRVVALCKERRAS